MNTFTNTHVPIIQWTYEPAHEIFRYSKTCVNRPLSKRQKIGFQDQLSLYAGQKYCRMLQGEHFAMLLTFIKLPFVIKIFVLSIFEWPLKTGFTVIITHAQKPPNNAFAG